MAYAITPPAHLIATAQGRKFAVWVNASPVGTQLIAVEYLTDGWNAFWSSVPQQDGDLQSEMDRMGGLKLWLRNAAATINAKFAGLFGGTGPAPLPGNSATERLINELNANWKLLVGADGVPVFGPK